MDASRFTDGKTGELVRISTPEGPDWAFVPQPLPPAWRFPESLWPLLAQAREQLARLDEKGRTVANPTLLLQPLQKREALRSSSLEGTYATAKELLLFELNPREASSSSDPANAWREVFNYDQALRLGLQALTAEAPAGLPLSHRLIRNMHAVLLAGVRGRDKGAGEFRRRQVHVGSDKRYVPPPPEVVPRCMDDLEKFLHSGHGGLDPLVVSYLVHYQFEAIHPFLDGNGRVGRALLALTTFRWGGYAQPWLYMSAYFERYKDEYVDNLFRVSTHGDWGRWVEFCLRGTAEQCRDALQRCDQLNQLREEMHEKLGAYPRMHKIVEVMFRSPVFSAATIAKQCSTSMPTARGDLGRMVQAGFVKHLAGERPRHYYVPRIFSAAYSEDFEGGGEGGGGPA